MRFATAIPIPPGKTDRLREFSRTCLETRREEYNDLQKRAGISLEEYWIQPSPGGDLMIVVSDNDSRRFGEILANPETDFDRWFRDQVRTILDFDPADFITATTSEYVGEYRAQ
jgi:hypothetical protein